MRHAFRNALLPLASIVPIDIITLLGGAVLTETVFGWFGMGRLFVVSLDDNQQDPVMAYIVIVGILAVAGELRRRPDLRGPRPADPGGRMSTPLEPTGGTSSPIRRSDTVENAIELKDVEGLSQGQIVRRRFFRHRGALVGLLAAGRWSPCWPTPRSAPSASPGWWKFDHFTPGDVAERRPPDHEPAHLAGRERLRHRRPPVRPGRDRPRHLRPHDEGHPDLAQRDGHHQRAGRADRHGDRRGRGLLPRRGSTSS